MRNLGGIIAIRDILLRGIRVLKISAFIALKITGYVTEIVVIALFIHRDAVIIMTLF